MGRSMDDVVIDMIAVSLGGCREPGSMPANDHDDLSLGGPVFIGYLFHLLDIEDVEALVYRVSVHLIVKPVQLPDPITVDI